MVSSKDGSVTCLLGASPGASTATSVMLQVLEKAFPEILHSEEGKAIMDKMIPFYNAQVDEALFKAQLKQSALALKL